MTHRTEQSPESGLRLSADMAPQVEEPDPYQLVRMEELRELLRVPGVDLTIPEHVERLFVDWCCRWHATPPTERWNPMTSLTALGIAVGDLVRAQRPDLRWCVVADCSPTTLVLADAQGHAVASPLTDIATWWMSRELAGITVLLARLAVAPVAAGRHAPLQVRERTSARSVA